MKKYNPKKKYCNYFPNEFFGINYNHACYLHDEHYGFRVKKRGSRKETDIKLKKDVDYIFSIAGKSVKGFVVSNLMYSAVRLLGWMRWNK